MLFFRHWPRIISIFAENNRNKGKYSCKKSVMSGQNSYLCDVRREKSPGRQGKRFCFRPKERNRQVKYQGDEKGMTLIRRCICRLRPRRTSISKTAWEHCYLFISGKAFGDACFLMDGNKSSRLFRIVKPTP